MAVVVTETAHANGRIITAEGTAAEVHAAICAGTGLSDVKYVYNPFNCIILIETHLTIGTAPNGGNMGFTYWTPTA